MLAALWGDGGGLENTTNSFLCFYAQSNSIYRVFAEEASNLMLISGTEFSCMREKKFLYALIHPAFLELLESVPAENEEW